MGSAVLALILASSSEPIPSAIPNPNSSLDLDCYLDFNLTLIPVLAGAPWTSRVQRRERRTGKWLLSPREGRHSRQNSGDGWREHSILLSPHFSRVELGSWVRLAPLESQVSL